MAIDISGWVLCLCIWIVVVLIFAVLCILKNNKTRFDKLKGIHKQNMHTATKAGRIVEVLNNSRGKNITFSTEDVIQIIDFIIDPAYAPNETQAYLEYHLHNTPFHFKNFNK